MRHRGPEDGNDFFKVISKSETESSLNICILKCVLWCHTDFAAVEQKKIRRYTGRKLKFHFWKRRAKDLVSQYRV